MAKKPCSTLQFVAALQGQVDARTGNDSSKAYKDFSPGVMKKYLEGYNQHAKTLDQTTPAGKWGQFAKKRPWLSLSHIQDPKTILGENYTRPIVEAGIEWNKAVYKAKAQDDIARQKELWEDIVKPVAEDLQDTLEMDFHQPSRREYAGRYLQDIIAGTDAFGSNKNLNPFEKLSDVLVQGTVSNNPVIMGLNFLEYGRTVNVLGPHKAVAGMIKAAGKQKMMFWKEVPELRELGVYGRPQEEHRTGLVTLSDNWLRTASYYAGESFKGGQKGGLDATRKVAFAYQIGNMPEMIRSESTRSSITLMRYGLEFYKFLGQGAKDIAAGVVKKDPKRALAGAWLLGSWYVMQNVMYGKKSVAPEFVWDIIETLDPEFGEEFLRDDETTNQFKNLTGVDLSKKMQPGNITLGVKWIMWERFLRKTGQSGGKMLEAIRNGDDKEAWIEGGKTAMRVTGGFGGFPSLVDINTERASDIFAEMLRGETELQETPLRLVEKTVPLAEPMTTKGIEEKKRSARYQ